MRSLMILIAGVAVGCAACVATRRLPDAWLIGGLIAAVGAAIGCACYVLRDVLRVIETRRVIRRSVRFYNCGLRMGNVVKKGGKL